MLYNAESREFQMPRAKSIPLRYSLLLVLHSIGVLSVKKRRPPCSVSVAQGLNSALLKRSKVETFDFQLLTKQTLDLLSILKITLFLLLCLSSSPGYSQHFNFAQYNYTPLRVNPALVATDNDAYLIVNYRSQGTTADVRFNTSMVSLTYPLLSRTTKRRWGGVGISAMDDRTGSGGMYVSQTTAANFAYNFALGSRRMLSLGIQGNYHVKRISTDGFSTGNQYFANRGYDPSALTGENFDDLRLNYFTFSTGAYWYELDEHDRKKAYAGLAIRDFNQSSESFLKRTNPVPVTLIINGGFRVYDNRNIAVTPEVLFSRSAGDNLLNLGASFSYGLGGKPSPNPDRMDLAARYVVGKAAILSAQFVQQNYIIGFSYDLPLSTQPTSNTFQGATEFTLALKKTIEPGKKKARKKKRKKARKKKRTKKSPRRSTSVRQANEKDQGQPNNKAVSEPDVEKGKEKISVQEKAVTVPPKSEKEQPAKTVEKLPAVTNQATQPERDGSVLPGKMNQRFEFDFAKTALNEEAKRYLDELAQMMKQNPGYHLLITGHTDNVGSAAANELISLERATNALRYLTRLGIDPSRIQAEGKGAATPLLPNDTPEQRDRNRRVAFILYQP